MPRNIAPTTPLEKRRALIRALRQVPDNFIWDFEIFLTPHPCGSSGCALGLAQVMGILDATELEDEAIALGISDEESDKIFYSTDPYGAKHMHDVTPAMVADALAALPDPSDA